MRWDLRRWEHVIVSVQQTVEVSREVEVAGVRFYSFARHDWEARLTREGKLISLTNGMIFAIKGLGAAFLRERSSKLHSSTPQRS